MHAVGIVTVVAAIVAAGAMAGNWWSRWRDRRDVELITKPLATIAIAALALSVSDDAPTSAVIAALIGFGFCLAGDVALLPAIDRFVIGLGAFLVGHLAFVVMFIELGVTERVLAGIALAGVIGVAWLLGRRIVAGAARRDATLATPVRAYLLVISTMGVVGWATGLPAAIVGSTLFVASDSVLGWGQFVREQRWMPVAIMATYHGALLGLALSLA